MLGAACLCAVSLNSCKKDLTSEPVSMPQGGICELVINASSGLSTKVTNPDQDKTIADIQVFVFNGEVLEAYGSAAAASASVECTTGAKDIYVVANAPSYSSVASKTALLATLVDLKSNAANKLVMAGSKSVTLAKSQTVPVQVSRLVSRVAIRKITRQSEGSLANASFSIKQIYLRNAGGNINLGRTTSPSSFYNAGNVKTDCPALLSETVNKAVANDTEYTTAHYFYSMPVAANACSLVVEAELAGRTVYYSVPLPKMEGNKSYEIANMTVRHFGSENPGETVDVAAADFTVTVKDWETVSVEEPII